MSFKSRLLTTAFVLPVTGWLALTPTQAFDLTGVGDDVNVTDTVTVSDPRDDDNNVITEAENILIYGDPSDRDAGLLVDSDIDIELDGSVGIRDRDADGALVTLTDAYGVRITSPMSGGNSVRLKAGGDIFIIEVRGPDYDGEDDNFLPDENDDDADGIIEGSPALSGDNVRIGLSVENSIGVDTSLASQLQYSLIGETGSFITVEGNAANVGDVAAVSIGGDLAGHLDLLTRINVFGTNARGVDINNTIGGNYRQRGDIDVRGEGGVGIDVGAAISGSMMIEGHINATGYSTIPNGSPGGPTRGGEDFDATNEFDETRRQTNPNERLQSRAAVEIAANIGQGLIVGGLVDSVHTKDERDSLQEIADRRSDADNDNDDVTALKVEPYHFDENRGSARLTSYGESEATLLISADLSSALGGTKETFLDTVDDDDDDTAASDDDSIDPYDSTAEFFYSHGLLNRGRIEADGLYDSVNWSGGNYTIDRPATALKLDGGVIHGGIYNSGTISAQAYNADATAIYLESGALTDGLRDDGSIFLNEGTIRAITASHTKSYHNATRDSFAATAVKIGAVTLSGLTGTPEFTNAGSISTSSSHTQLNDASEADDDYEIGLGNRAIAFDLTDINAAFNLTQRLREADSLVGSGANSASNPYQSGGDTDIDRTGNIGQNDDGLDINVGDGKVDTRDVVTPSIFGDVLFHSGDHDNQVRLTAGSLRGHISFGGGTDSLLLGNSMADDANSENDDPSDDIDDTNNDYTAPTTSFRGRISHSGTLNIEAGGQTSIVGEKTLVHFVGQEGVDLNDDGDDADAGEEFEGLEINNLTLSEDAQLRFSINPDFLGETTALLDVTNFSLGDDVTISLDITRLLDGDQQLVLLEADNDLNAYATGINDRQPEGVVYPFVYDVALAIDESGANDRLVANYSLKSSNELGLNINEEAAFQSVIKHFMGKSRLESALTGLAEQDDFKAAYRQLLPHYGDGSMKQLATLAQSATGAVSQHLQISSADGRRGGDGWVQQFGDFRKRTAGAEINTLSGTSYGLALGFDLPTGSVDAIGGFAQMSFTSVNEKTSQVNEVKAESFSLGAYLADTVGPVRYELNAAAGSVAFDGTRVANFNGVGENVSAAWDGTSISASARLAYPILDFRHLLRLEAGVDYFSLEQDAYRERTRFSVDPELAMSLGKAESEALTNYIGLRGGFSGGGGSPSEIVWKPNYYLGYRTTTDYAPYEATANFASAADNVPSFVLKADDELADMAEIGFGIAAHNDYFAFEFNYRGQYGEDTEVHGGGISVRLLF